MPTDHQEYLKWNGDHFRKWAENIGINTYKCELFGKVTLAEQRLH